MEGCITQHLFQSNPIIRFISEPIELSSFNQPNKVVHMRLNDVIIQQDFRIDEPKVGGLGIII